MAWRFKAIPLAAVLVLALSSPDAYAEKDALINVTASSNSDDSGPAFLNYAKEQQTQKNNESVKATEDKNNNTKTTNKKNIQKTNKASRQAAIIAQKDKTIRQLRQQLDAKPATISAVPGNQEELTNKINQLQAELTVAVTEKQKLIDKERSVVAEEKKSTSKLDAAENKILLQEQRLTSAESAKQKLEVLLAEVTTEKQTLVKKIAVAETEKQNTAKKFATAISETQALMTKLAAETKERQVLAEKLATSAPDKQALATKLAAAETSQQALTTKLAAADAAQQALKAKLAAAETARQALTTKLAVTDAAQQVLKTKLDTAETAQKEMTTQLTASTAEKQDLAGKLAAAITEKQALTAKLDSLTISKQQSIRDEGSSRLQAEKDKALLQTSLDEINQLKSRLADAENKPDKKSTTIDLAKEPQQQAYSIGVSMGDEALKVLSTRNTQGIKIDKNTVLQGILDSFSGKIAIDEKTRNKALFDVSKKVFQNLNKIEQQTVSDGKKYQQKFAKQKGVVFKDGVYSRIDYAGEGRILDSDTVTVTIKETLVDGTVINDMEAEGKVWSQTLKSYPPIFLGPIKRLGNHGSITVVIPPDLAYGSEGRPPKIPPGATMIYSVRIVDATAAEPQAKKP
ncbi:FKBP-type peptidyl-prolyl cis-trans isomerase [Klebsiella sp. RHBSTW-00215]|uniref:FKBP-type peptidyl-prolyl cis-trans isomerase N-terminal domain-containing protein n=1 Tax=Klebsiella sp. RHBSTW-00215 TaxID=2742640 RepID=UPI0015F37B21|nr:FKBP-type peptidyl-prolyl cis-trans isomerase N-terminal domain-containing protein [Klebsiella sp. RHBSTW-00215]MBA7932051.1 FKBP-type peptidyl-prolyl cis-trans isomerase [Klebsiella sp. RHBSTW-00215]